MKFFENLIDDLLLPKGLATEKEKEFIYLKCAAARSKYFWEIWKANYDLYATMNGGPTLKTYVDSEFQTNPVALLNGKIGSMPENIFNIHFYLEKIARFAADFQTEWKTPHFFIRKNEAGANLLVEESNSVRNQEAEQIVYEIWDLMKEFDQISPSIIDYYNSVSGELSGTSGEHSIDEIYVNIFGNSRSAKDFEQKRFDLLIKYAKVLFAVKDNWESRLDKKYTGFTDLEDVKNTVETILEKRFERIDSIFPE